MRILSFFKKLFSRRKKPVPKKIGLALGSGGAKGFAHLGALKAFEEEGISFDVVTGTSIGSIIGALYAKGYSSTDICELVKTVAFRDLAKHVRLRMNMSPIEEMLSSYLGDIDFSDLKLPFACWATDEDSNEGVLLNSGNLARACCASSAMPPFFAAVKIGDSYLADGAFTNAIPSDVARDMGADFVIGIDLSSPKYASDKTNGGTVLSFLLKKFALDIPEKELPNARSRGYENADVMLEPDLKNFRATDFSARAWDEMYEAGYAQAKQRMPEIKEKLKEQGF